MNTKKRVGIYARVSTNEQSTFAQEEELKEYANKRAWQVIKIYRDIGWSGAKASRPALNELMMDARKRKLDLVLCWRFDRFARSTSHLIAALEEFRTLGVEFASVCEALDTSTAMGKMIFVVLGAVGELEKSLINQRVRLGIESARKRGKRLGRPPLRVLTAAELEQIRRDRVSNNLSVRQLAKKFGISVWAAHRACSNREQAA